MGAQISKAASDIRKHRAGVTAAIHGNLASRMERANSELQRGSVSLGETGPG